MTEYGPFILISYGLLSYWLGIFVGARLWRK